MQALLAEEIDLCRSVVAIGKEVVPRFRVLIPGGPDYHVLMPMPDDEEVRLAGLRLLHDFMAWKSARGYLMLCELGEPNPSFR